MAKQHQVRVDWPKAAKSLDVLMRRGPEIAEDLVHSDMSNKQVAEKYGLNRNFVARIAKALPAYHELIALAQKTKLQGLVSTLLNDVVEDKTHLRLKPADKFNALAKMIGTVNTLGDVTGKFELKVSVKANAREAAEWSETIHGILKSVGLEVPSTGIIEITDEVVTVIEQLPIEEAETTSDEDEAEDEFAL